MTCERIRISISAALDGEAAPDPPAVVDAHLAGCASCRRFHASALRLHREVRVAPTPEVPDLTASILHAIGEDTRRAADVGPLRVVVAIMGLVQLGLFLPALLFGDDAGLPVHSARHLGSFGVALGIGLVVAAWRPERVAGLLPLATALVGCLVLTSVLDVTTADVAIGSELNHAAEVVGLVALWLLGRAVPRPRLDVHAA